jgi:hypothetical protein
LASASCFLNLLFSAISWLSCCCATYAFFAASRAACWAAASSCVHTARQHKQHVSPLQPAIRYKERTTQLYAKQGIERKGCMLCCLVATTKHWAWGVCKQPATVGVHNTS